MMIEDLIVFRFEIFQFVFGVEYVDVEWTSWNVDSRPLYMHNVISKFRWIVTADDSSILLLVPLHLHVKGICMKAIRKSQILH